MSAFLAAGSSLILDGKKESLYVLVLQYDTIMNLIAFLEPSNYVNMQLAALSGTGFQVHINRKVGKK